MRRLARWGLLYRAIIFVILIPVTSYWVITKSAPNEMMLFVPLCALLAWSFYASFKFFSKPK